MFAMPTDPSRRTPRQVQLLALIWISLTCVSIAIVFSRLLPANLDSSNALFLFLSYLAFMIRTFTFHMGIAVAIVTIVACILRVKRAILACFVLLVITLGPALLSLRPREIAPAGSSPALRVLSANLLVDHANVDRLLDLVRRENPDILLFQEYTAAKNEKLRPALEAEYPYIADANRNDAFGQAVYSKLPFAAPSVLFPPAELGSNSRTGGVVGLRDPQIRVVISFAGRDLVLQDLHLVPPIGVSYHHEQRQMAKWLASWAKDEPRPKIMAGDLNATPDSTILDALHNAGMHQAHAEAGRGRGVSWPYLGLLRYAPGIRIDHILASNQLRCVDSHVAGFIDSDHEAIVAEYVWR